MSQKKPTSIDALLSAGPPTASPSIEFAKMLMKPFFDGYQGDQDRFDMFDMMEHESHPDYYPSFGDVCNWAHKSLPETDYSNKDFLDKFNECISRDFTPALEEFSAGHISAEQLIEIVSKNFLFLDDDVHFGGTVAMKHWHAARIWRQSLRIHNFNGEIVDAVYAVPLGKLAHAIQQLERLQAGQEVHAIKIGTHEELDRALESMQDLLNRMPQIVDTALRMGFLYRDAWWIENHGEITIKGYLSELRSARAGELGGKQSNKQRKQRIRYFLIELAKLISENPILRDDPPEDVAYRAVKIAAKKHPEAFRRGASKRSAREYWEYILADQELLNTYKNLIITKLYSGSA